MFRRGVKAVVMTPGDLLTRLSDFEDGLVYPVRLDAPPMTDYVAPPASKTRPVFDFRPANMADVCALVETLARYNLSPRVIVRVDDVAFTAYPDVHSIVLALEDTRAAVLIRIIHRGTFI